MTHFQVTFTDKAEYDLAEILSYIGEDSMENAVAFVDKIFTKITDTLSIMPSAGTLFGQRKGYEVRTFVVHKAYTAFYVILEDKKRIEIISVFSTHKDEKKFWKELKTQGIYRFPNKKI